MIDVHLVTTFPWPISCLLIEFVATIFTLQKVRF